MKQVEVAFDRLMDRGDSPDVEALIARLHTELNDIDVSPTASPILGARPPQAEVRTWRGLTIAASAFVMALLIGVPLLLMSEDEPQTPASDPGVQTTSVPSSIPVLADTPATDVRSEAPWVEGGEARMGSTVVTAKSLSVNGGVALLEFEVTTLAPSASGPNEDEQSASPAVLPERWELETTQGVIEATTASTVRSVRFPVDDGLVLEDVIETRIVGWRTLVPVTYDFVMPRDVGAFAEMPDGTTVTAVSVLEMKPGTVVSFDVVQRPRWGPVACGDGMLGFSCFDPTHDSGWTPRQSDSDLQVISAPDWRPTEVELRYVRPLWVASDQTVSLSIGSATTLYEESTPFPSGYVQVTEDVGVKPDRILRYGDQTLVSMTSVVRRDTDHSTAESLMGGRWVLESVSGEAVESIGMTFDDEISGAFAVVFPSTDTSDGYVSIRLIERWLPEVRSGRGDGGAVTGIPSRLDSPVDVDLGGMTVRIDMFNLEGIGGPARWGIVDDDVPPAVVTVVGQIARSDGGLLAETDSWEDTPRHFGLSNTGRLFWFYLESLDPETDFEQELADDEYRLVLVVSAEIPTPVAVEIVFDLTAVPVS